MLVLKLCQQFCPDKIVHSIGNRLGDGADGEVFDITDELDKVIKFCVLYETGSVKLLNTYKYISKSLNYLMLNNDPAYARVYAHEYMGQYVRDAWQNKKQKYILYYYVMEKLQQISDDERKVFDSLVSHEDRGKKKNYTPDKVKEILLGLNRGLDFNFERVIFFYDSLKKSKIKHLDMHPRNIMKDANGNFKLIDFDRTQFIGDKSWQLEK
jgi:serine/threonine protein kinase